nr:hypothetical protein [Halalkalibacter akibai]
MQKTLGVHESLELHELLTFKNLCLTKATTMKAIVNCEQLQSLMEQDIQNSTQAIQQYQSLMQK